MEKKFVIIMASIIFLLTITLGVLIFSILDINFNFGTNRETPDRNVSETIAGDPSEDITEQDEEGYVDGQDFFPPVQLVGETFPGNLFEFGEITWRVLDVRDGKMLLLSEHVLEYRRYHHGSGRDLTWETSDMREWLNSEFYNRFAEDDRARIAETNVINKGNFWFWYETPGGEGTTDKIFLLSLEELVYYFGDSGVLVRGRRTEEGSVIGDQYNIKRRAQKLNAETYSEWLLRTPGSSVDLAMFVTEEGLIWMFGTRLESGVRPALWLYMTPQDYVSVAQTYINLRQHDEATAVLQQGLEAFPGNTEIQELLTYVLEMELYFEASEIQSIIKFGDMQWRVLDVTEDRMLLLSEFVLEPRAYHNEFVDITWANSDIRRWLNGEFYNSFTAEERRLIAETRVINNDNPWFGTPGGPDTRDKIFLLSLEELALYFCDSGQLREQGRGPASWAINNQFGNRLEAVGLFGDGLTQSWWLRSPGSHAELAAHVSFFGVVYVSGYLVDCYEFMSIRPAMWVYL